MYWVDFNWKLCYYHLDIFENPSVQDWVRAGFLRTTSTRSRIFDSDTNQALNAIAQIPRLSLTQPVKPFLSHPLIGPD